MKLISSFSRKSTRLILILVAVVFVTSCSKKKYPDNLTFIPKDVTLLVSVDLEAITKKVDVKDFKKSSTYALLSEGLLSSEPSLRKLLDHPEKSGIDFKQLFAFVTPKKAMGFTFAIKSSSDFQDVVKRILKEENVQAPIGTTSECSYITIPRKNNICMVWDDDKALFISNASQEEAIKIFTTKKDAGIVTDKDFADFYKGRKEIALWAKNETFYNLLGNELFNELLGSRPFSAASGSGSDLVKGTYTHINLEFVAGRINISSAITPLDKAKKFNAQFYNKTTNNELLKYLPEKSFLLAKTSLNMPAVMKQLAQDKDAASQMTPEMQAIGNSLKGDMVCSVYNFSDAGAPEMTLLLTVKDKKVFDALLQLATDFGGVKKQKKGYTSVSVMFIPFFVSQKGEVLMISSGEQEIASFVNGNTPSPNLFGSTAFKGLKESPSYLYFDMDLSHYPSSLTSLLAELSGDKFKTVLFFKDIQMSYDPQKATGSYVINLQDTNTNSLSVILNKMDQLAVVQ